MELMPSPTAAPTMLAANNSHDNHNPQLREDLHIPRFYAWPLMHCHGYSSATTGAKEWR
jgi:hypothetical protein